jgi:hypothetical protein
MHILCKLSCSSRRANKSFEAVVLGFKYRKPSIVPAELATKKSSLSGILLVLLTWVPAPCCRCSFCIPKPVRALNFVRDLHFVVRSWTLCRHSDCGGLVVGTDMDGNEITHASP